MYVVKENPRIDFCFQWNNWCLDKTFRFNGGYSYTSYHIGPLWLRIFKI